MDEQTCKNSRDIILMSLESVTAEDFWNEKISNTNVTKEEVAIRADFYSEHFKDRLNNMIFEQMKNTLGSNSDEYKAGFRDGTLNGLLLVKEFFETDREYLRTVE